MSTKRILAALSMVLAIGLIGATNVRAQSYFYGYYYPDEHRFNSPMLNTSVYNYTTITPMWNATHDSLYGYPSNLYSVPSTSPLPTSSPYPSPKLLGSNTAPAGAPASIRVTLPNASANVWFEGHSTRTTGTDRVYQSPPIAAGKTYSYQIKAAWMDGDRQVVEERTIAVRPGQSAVLDFTQTESAKK